MVKSIVSFDNLYDYKYSIKKGKIFCEDDDMLMEVHGRTYGVDNGRLPVFVGNETKEYLKELCRLLGIESRPIYTTLFGENLLLTTVDKDTLYLEDVAFSSTPKTVRIIVHVEKLVENELCLVCMQVE